MKKLPVIKKSFADRCAKSITNEELNKSIEIMLKSPEYKEYNRRMAIWGTHESKGDKCHS